MIMIMTSLAYLRTSHNSCLNVYFNSVINLQISRQYRLENELHGNSFFILSVAVKSNAKNSAHADTFPCRKETAMKVSLDSYPVEDCGKQL